jgi:hypothetical protein
MASKRTGRGREPLTFLPLGTAAFAGLRLCRPCHSEASSGGYTARLRVVCGHSDDEFRYRAASPADLRRQPKQVLRSNRPAATDAGSRAVARQSDNRSARGAATPNALLCRQMAEVIARSRLPASEGERERLAQQLGGHFEGGFGRVFTRVFEDLDSVAAHGWSYR